ncbi:MAG: tripartite tricarboxylate transporter substrate binding protein [Betaproteobacteria bacterium]|nr:MAG: tripartite tricarboxylate transporter substrate binding protein [Betaproteobacteria bacterium]
MINPAGRRLVLTILIALGASPTLAAVAPDAAWPARPVRLIVPFPPGGAVDPLARLLSARLPAALGQPFVVDNRPGASGSIGMAIVAKSPPDGYTFALTFNTQATNPSLIPTLPYDTVRDFAPVMLIGTAPSAIVTHPSKPYQGFGDAIKVAKAKPDTITYGSIGSGSLGQLAMTLLQQAGGFRIVHVPYKGGGPMTTDILGGQIDLAIASVQILSPHVRAGKLRALAVTGETRSRTMPDVPALAEQGFSGFSVLAWGAVFGPAGIPQPVLDKFHGELVRIFNQPDVRNQLGEQLGMDIVASSPAALQKFLVSEIERWGKVIRENKIRAD